MDMTRMKEPSLSCPSDPGPTPISLAGHVLFTGKTWAHTIPHPWMQDRSIKNTFQPKAFLEAMVHQWPVPNSETRLRRPHVLFLVCGPSA